MFDVKNNRRTRPRAPVQLAARVVWPGGEADTRLLLISEGGCFIALEAPPAKDTRLKLSFDIPGRGPHTATVEVRYRGEIGDHGGRRDIPGVGCQFTLVSTTTKQAIADLITQLKKSYAQLQSSLAITKPDPHLNALLEKAQLVGVRDGPELREAVQWGLKQMGL